MNSIKTVVLCLMLFVGTKSHACSCLPSAGILESRDQADAVFVGTPVVISFESRGKIDTHVSLGQKAYFHIDKTWKGTSDATARIYTGMGGGDCGKPFKIGTPYLVYGKKANDGWSAHLCSRTTESVKATEDLALLGS